MTVRSINMCVSGLLFTTISASFIECDVQSSFHGPYYPRLLPCEMSLAIYNINQCHVLPGNHASLCSGLVTLGCFSSRSQLREILSLGATGSSPCKETLESTTVLAVVQGLLAFTAPMRSTTFFLQWHCWGRDCWPMLHQHFPLQGMHTAGCRAM